MNNTVTRPECPYCQRKTLLAKAGFMPRVGPVYIQRWRCLECGHTFLGTYHTKCPLLHL